MMRALSVHFICTHSALQQTHIETSLHSISLALTTRFTTTTTPTRIVSKQISILLSLASSVPLHHTQNSVRLRTIRAKNESNNKENKKTTPEFCVSSESVSCRLSVNANEKTTVKLWIFEWKFQKFSILNRVSREYRGLPSGRMVASIQESVKITWWTVWHATVYGSRTKTIVDRISLANARQTTNRKIPIAEKTKFTRKFSAKGVCDECATVNCRWRCLCVRKMQTFETVWRNINNRQKQFFSTKYSSVTADGSIE